MLKPTIFFSTLKEKKLGSYRIIFIFSATANCTYKAYLTICSTITIMPYHFTENIQYHYSIYYKKLLGPTNHNILSYGGSPAATTGGFAIYKATSFSSIKCMFYRRWIKRSILSKKKKEKTKKKFALKYFVPNCLRFYVQLKIFVVLRGGR